MHIFAEYVSAEKAFELHCKANKRPVHTLEDFRKAAHSKGKCEVCGQPVWKMAMTGLCFSCTTGEPDASNDYELAQCPSEG